VERSTKKLKDVNIQSTKFYVRIYSFSGVSVLEPSLAALGACELVEETLDIKSIVHPSNIYAMYTSLGIRKMHR
jgi:hypothetical protein